MLLFQILKVPIQLNQCRLCADTVYLFESVNYFNAFMKDAGFQILNFTRLEEGILPRSKMGKGLRKGKGR